MPTITDTYFSIPSVWREQSMKRVFAGLVLLACLIGMDMMVGRRTLSGESVAAFDFEQKMMIGLLLPLSGERADEGRSAKRGFEMAAEGLRSWGTATSMVDSRCDPAYAKRAVESLIEAGSEVVIGALCPSVARLAEENLAAQGIALVSLGTGEVRTAWRADAYTEEKAGALADYFVTWHQDDYGAEPDHLSALAFDVLTAVAMELRDNAGDDQELLEHFRVMEHYGVSGVVRFRLAE